MKQQTKLPYWPKWLRAAFKIHGGKRYLARKIWLNAPPEFSMFIDGFGGAGNVALNAPADHPIVFIEKDHRRYAVMECIQNRSSELVATLSGIKYNERVWAHHTELDKSHEAGQEVMDTLPIAISYIVRHRMSRGGLGTAYGWSDRKRGGRPGDLNAWLTMIDLLPSLAARVADWRIVNGEFLKVYGRMNDATLRRFVYLDPTYLKSVRSTSAKEYGKNEMSPQQHEELLSKMLESHDFVAISGYRSEMYDRMLKGWNTVEFDLPNNSGQGKKKQRRKEVLYMNY